MKVPPEIEEAIIEQVIKEYRQLTSSITKININMELCPLMFALRDLSDIRQQDSSAKSYSNIL